MFIIIIILLKKPMIFIFSPVQKYPRGEGWSIHTLRARLVHRIL